MTTKILQINTSLNTQESMSKTLSSGILDKIKLTYPDILVNTRDLANNPLPHLDSILLSAYHTLEEQRTEIQKKAIRKSDLLIQELVEADIIIIGVPMYNFGIPSTLKAWIDHVARANKTFSYSEKGPKGLLTNKRVYLAISSGGVYSEGPMECFDFTENYLRASLGFLGMTDLNVFRIEGIAVANLAEKAVSNALKEVNTYSF